MAKLFFKIHAYNNETHSFSISFATSDSTKPVEEYPAYNFNATHYLNLDQDTFLKRIAYDGLSIAKEQDKHELVTANVYTLPYLSTIGQTYEFDIDDVSVQKFYNRITTEVNITD
jgi:hypothetical protein